MALVSVVVPAYNSRRFIDETMRSILAQTLSDFELIVADHSSDDGTWEALQVYLDDPRVRLLRTPPGGGAPANWARVTAEATAPYLKLVCGDDVMAATNLERQVAALDAYPTVDLVASRRTLIDADGRVLVQARGLGGIEGLSTGCAAVRHAVRSGSNIFGEPACVLLRRSAFVARGGWDAEQPYVIDQATFCNVLMGGGDFLALPEPLASFRISPQQWSRELAAHQASQVVTLHERLARQYPGLLSAADVRLGNTRARLMAGLRRLTHLAIGPRRA